MRRPPPDPHAWPIGRGIIADIPALLRLRHRCQPGRCPDRPSCCQVYEVCLTPAEVDRVTGLIPACASYAPGLKGPGGYLNPFDPVGGRLFAIDEDEDGRCAFSYPVSGGGTRCALHSAALDLQLDPYQTKPRSCALWPLAIRTGRPRLLTTQDDAYTFSCNRRRSATVASLDDGVAAIIAGLFGAPVLRAVERAIAVSRDG